MKIMRLIRSEMFNRYLSNGLIYLILSNCAIFTAFTRSVLYAQRLEASDANFILDFHNDVRKQFAMDYGGGSVANMNRLVWDTLLYFEAEDTVSCEETFISQEETVYEVHISRGTTLNGNLSSILHSWSSEKTNFLPSFGTCLYLQECMHFLKMINARHSKLGCAYKKGCSTTNGEMNILLCLYAGGSKIVPAFKTGPLCSKCSEPNNFCRDGLCVECNRTDGRLCDCRKTCTRPGIGIGELDTDSCTCRCTYGLGPNCDEDCVNPQSYIDFDPCDYVQKSECLSGSEEERRILAEFCPAKCVCRRHPLARVMQNLTANV